MESSPVTNPPRSRRMATLLLSGILGLAIIAGLGYYISTTRANNAAATVSINDPTKTGCPSRSANVQWPTKPAITLTQDQANMEKIVSQGDTVAFSFPAGFRWSIASYDTTMAQLQMPSGAYRSATHTCEWYFTIKTTGTTAFAFDRQPLCEPNRVCTPLIIQYRFEITAR